MGFENSYSQEDWEREATLNRILGRPASVAATHNQQMCQLIESNQSVFGKEPWSSRADILHPEGDDAKRIINALRCAFIQLRTTIGNRVTFAHPEWADTEDREHARRFLTAGHDYHLAAVLVSDQTWVWLEEFPNHRFNGVMFTEAEN